MRQGKQFIYLDAQIVDRAGLCAVSFYGSYVTLEDAEAAIWKQVAAFRDDQLSHYGFRVRIRRVEMECSRCHGYGTLSRIGGIGLKNCPVCRNDNPREILYEDIRFHSTAWMWMSSDLFQATKWGIKEIRERAMNVAVLSER